MPNRIHCTWMGDPSKVILLEAVLDTIAKDNLQQVVNDSGKVLLAGLHELQVRDINLSHPSPGTPRITPVPVWFGIICIAINRNGLRSINALLLYSGTNPVQLHEHFLLTG